MNTQRKLTLMVATVGVALGAGHFVQKRASERFAAEATAETTTVVTDVTPVAAGPSDLPAAPPVTAALVPTLHEPPTAAEALPPEDDAMAKVDPTPAPVAESPAPVLAAPSAPAAPAADMTVAPAPQLAEQDCTVQFDLIPQPGAMLGLSLLAPCHADQRVVLKHAGLAITAKTSASGSYFGTLPALTSEAMVEVRFASGEVASAVLSLPEADGLRRFAVQWQDPDAFQLHAFEAGAGYGEPGHFSAAQTGQAGAGAFLTILGDASTELPLLAEVFTFAGDRPAEIVLEAAVTAGTCGHEMIGETLVAEGGAVSVADLTLAMPGCDALGDILVLKNLMQDTKLASAR